MRLLCFADRPFGTGRYSADHQVLAELLATRLPARGHHVEMWLHASQPDAGGRVVPWHGAHVRLLPTVTGLGARARNALARVSAIRRDLPAALRGDQVDAVFVRNDWVAALAAAPALRAAGVPLVFQWSFPHPEVQRALAADGAAHPVLRRMRAAMETRAYAAALRRASLVVPVSEWMAADLATRGLAAERAMVPLPLGVETHEVPAAAAADVRARWAPDAASVVLYFGELGRLRRMEFLLDAFAHVHARRPGAVLLMVGAGDSPDDIERLRRHAARLGLDAAVRFTGLVPRAEIPAFIRAADVGVSPIRPIPLFEVSSPTKFVEMLGYGCPVVANDIPEQARILRESGGGVAVPYESRAFGDAIATLLADPEARRRMSAAGAAWVAEHRSLAVLTERLESALERICRPRRAGAEAE